MLCRYVDTNVIKVSCISDRTFQDKFSSYPNIQEILKQVKADNEARKQRLEAYYDDDLLAQLVSQ